MPELNFHKISTQDRIWMTEKFWEEQPEACEYSFVNNFIWRKSYSVEVAQICGCGVIRYQEKKNYRFSFPFGNGDKKAAIEAMMAYCHREPGKEYALDLCPITDRQRKDLIAWFPGKFDIESDRDDFDYVYSKEDLASLKGKKYHGKRNHIARFMDNDDWSYESLTADNIQECRSMSRDWLTFKEDKLEDGVEEENIALHEAFDHFEEFGLVGGLLRKEGKVVAFTIGEPLNRETMVVHFEKAYPNLQGAYPMINQQFVLHACGQYKYVNREEDVGDVGLRKAKLSYYPEILLKKYCAVESRVVFASEHDLEQIKILWQTCFGDEENYVVFYLKNRFNVENMLVIHQDGKPVSMASFLPVQLKLGEGWVPARYVYAVATLPEYRGQGLAAQILQYGFEKYQEPLLLQPETEDLRKYYEKLGFVDSFAAQAWEIWPEAGSSMDTELAEELGAAVSRKQTKAIVTPGVEPDAAARAETSMEQSAAAVDAGLDVADDKITAEEYKQIRDAYFDGDGYVCWDEAAIGYALAENDFCGGAAKKAGQNLILYKKEKDVLRVIETTLEGAILREQVQKLLAETGSAKAVYENKAGMIKYPAEMEKDMRSEQGNIRRGYLNLTLGG